MSVNRQSAPDYVLSSHFEFVRAQTRSLNNGVEVHYISDSKQDLIKLELLFDAGTKKAEHPVISKAVSALMTEGTNEKTSEELAKKIEVFGAFLDSSSSLDSSSITVYVLSESFDSVLEVIMEIVSKASFPEKELESYRSIQAQKHRVNREKVTFLAQERFKLELFPLGHPYYSQILPVDYEGLKREQLMHFYEEHIVGTKPRVYLAGPIDQSIWNSLEKHLGVPVLRNSKPYQNQANVIGHGSESIHVEKKEALQTALFLGKSSIGRLHKDYQKWMVVNTLFGGYFGSRLMMNIREDKGYTYGIGSGIMSYSEASYFMIRTEVGSAFAKKTMLEIEKEMIRLKEEEVPVLELKRVKNYLLGSLMRNFDGAFESLDRFKSLNEFQMDYSYYENLLDCIANLSQDDVMQIANKYLNFEECLKISAGK